MRLDLEIGRYLVVTREAQAEELAAAAGCSGISVKRAIGELRHMGAVIRSEWRGRSCWYVWENADACRQRLLQWVGLEEQRTLLERAD
jgi:DNA-binding GntR family transcriptional regulator